MANHSDAFGDVHITAPTLQILKDFVRLWELQDRNAYYTVSVYNTPKTDKEWASIIHTTDEQVEVCLSWTGIGKWSIKNNFEWLMDEIMTPDDSEDKERITLANTLSHYPVTMYFEYQEEEPGQELLEFGEVRIEWDPIRGEQSMEVLSVEHLDYTVTNLVTYGFYAPYDRVDGEWVTDHWDEYEDDLLANDDLLVISEIDNRTLKSIIRSTKGVYGDIDELIDEVVHTKRYTCSFTHSDGRL